MSETTKRNLLIAVIVVAVAFAGFTAVRSLGSPPLEPGVDNARPPGAKTGKQMEQENQGGTTADGTADARANSSDRG